MHRKQDEVSDQMSQFRRELRDTQQRVAALEEIGTENGAVQRASLARIQALEEELQDLRRHVIHVPSVSRHQPALMPRGATEACLGVRERTSGALSRSPRDLGSELQLVIGGWRDARKADAEMEVRQVFARAGLTDALQDVWAPFVRTTFMKIMLHFPEPDATVTARRSFQMHALQKLKALKPTSNVVGSEGRELWISKQRPPEERKASLYKGFC